MASPGCARLKARRLCGSVVDHTQPAMSAAARRKKNRKSVVEAIMRHMRQLNPLARSSPGLSSTMAATPRAACGLSATGQPACCATPPRLGLDLARSGWSATLGRHWTRSAAELTHRSLHRQQLYGMRARNILRLYGSRPRRGRGNFNPCPPRNDPVIAQLNPHEIPQRLKIQPLADGAKRPDPRSLRQALHKGLLTTEHDEQGRIREYEAFSRNPTDRQVQAHLARGCSRDLVDMSARR